MCITLLQHVKHLGLFREDGTFDVSLFSPPSAALPLADHTDLGQDLVDGITKGGDLLEEPYMSMCSLYARAHILRHLLDKSTATSMPGDTISEKCWFTFASSAVNMFSSLAPYEHFSPEFNTFETLSNYFRTSAYFTTLMTQLTLAPFTIRRRAVASLAERVASEETVDLEAVPRVLRFWIEAYQKDALTAAGPDSQSSAILLMRAD